MWTVCLTKEENPAAYNLQGDQTSETLSSEPRQNKVFFITPQSTLFIL